MISHEQVRKRLFDEFIKPTDQKKDFIGIEIEIPIVNLDKKAVDFDVVHEITGKFKSHYDDFKDDGIDYDGNVYALKNAKNDDIVCYDCSYNNIEFAMGREKDLFTINDRFTDYYSFVKESFEEHNHTLTGMGINPYRKYNRHLPIPSERYLMLYHHLKSSENYEHIPMHFHEYPEYGMFSSASQVQIDVHRDNLIHTINTFSKIEPIKALLFSNSVLVDENKHRTCFRDALWEYSTHGVNPHNIGMYNVDFNNLDDLQAYLESLNIYCVMRDGSYINFESMNLLDYFSREHVSGEIYSNGEYRQIDITPEIDDINYLRPFKFINLTFRGTVEFRSVCTQPIRDSMSVAAFHVGLKDKLDELDELIYNDNIIYHRGYNAGELRKLLIKDEIPAFIDKNDLCRLTKDVVDISRDGLLERGIGEEVFLDSLYERIKNRTNPGKNMITKLNDNTKLETMIEDYGKI